MQHWVQPGEHCKTRHYKLKAKDCTQPYSQHCLIKVCSAGKSRLTLHFKLHSFHLSFSKTCFHNSININYLLSSSCLLIVEPECLAETSQKFSCQSIGCISLVPACWSVMKNRWHLLICQVKLNLPSRKQTKHSVGMTCWSLSWTR